MDWNDLDKREFNRLRDIRQTSSIKTITEGFQQLLADYRKAPPPQGRDSEWHDELPIEDITTLVTRILVENNLACSRENSEMYLTKFHNGFETCVCWDIEEQLAALPEYEDLSDDEQNRHFTDRDWLTAELFHAKNPRTRRLISLLLKNACVK